MMNLPSGVKEHTKILLEVLILKMLCLHIKNITFVFFLSESNLRKGYIFRKLGELLIVKMFNIFVGMFTIGAI